MEISFDPEKRARTLAERDLDFLDAARVFEGRRLTQEDDRFALSRGALSDLWLAKWAARAGGVDIDRNGHPRDFDEELP